MSFRQIALTTITDSKIPWQMASFLMCWETVCDYIQSRVLSFDQHIIYSLAYFKVWTLQSRMSDCHSDSEDGAFDHLLKTPLTQSGQACHRGGFDSHKINAVILTAIR